MEYPENPKESMERMSKSLESRHFKKESYEKHFKNYSFNFLFIYI